MKTTQIPRVSGENPATSSNQLAFSNSQLPNGPLLLKPHEAARALAISERKLWELTKLGEIPHVRIGRSVRYVAVDLQTWIESRRRSGSSIG